MSDSQDNLDHSRIPADLPEDVRASYKPRSMFSPGSNESQIRFDTLTPEEEALRLKLDSQKLAIWQTAYGDQHESSPLSRDAPPLEPDNSGTRPAIILQKMIGKGGFGEVWAATQTSLGRVVAVKRVREDIFADTVVTESTSHQVELSFRQEALTAANLDHPNIVPLHDLGRDEKGRAMLSMKLVRGRSWEEIMEEDRQEADPPAFLIKHLQILIQVAQAVAFAHSRGIVHRDLKPGQVMVGEYGEVLLMDWGLAVVYDTEKARIDGSTFLDSGLAPTCDVATNPAGTIVYMAPEQTEKTSANIGPWTDMWLLGGTLYTILTDSTPYRAAGNVAAFYKAMRGEVERPSLRAPKAYIPDELERLCQWAMEPRLDKRLKCAKTFIRELQAYLSGANRRLEAEKLLDEAEELFVSAVSYETFGRAILAVERAGKLWPENTQSFDLQQRLVTAWAELALRNEDLILARIQGQRIADTATRDRLMLAVERKELEQTDANRKKVFFRRVTAFSVLVMIISLGLHYGFILSTREELETANSRLNSSLTDLASKERTLARTNESLREVTDRAISQRERAEELVAFLALDLSAELNRLGRARLMEQAAQPLVRYYMEQSLTDGADARSQRNRASALMMEAMLDRINGRPAESVAKLEDAVERVRQLILGNPDEPEYVEMMVRLQLEVARSYESVGDPTRASVGAEQALEAARVLQSLLVDDPEADYLKSEALAAVGRIRCATGDMAGAAKSFEQAEGILMGLIRTQESGLYRQLADIGLANLYAAQSLVDWESGKPQLGYERLQQATALRTVALEREPWNLTVRESMAEASLFKALMQYDMGRFHTARLHLDEATRQSSDVINLDGMTLRRQVESAYILALKALANWRMYNWQEALFLANEAVDRTASRNGGEAAEAQSLALARALTMTVRGITEDPERDQSQQTLRQALSLWREHLKEPAKSANHELSWFAIAASLTGDALAPELLKLVAERGIRRREVYEAAFTAGLVERSNDFSIRLR